MLTRKDYKAIATMIARRRDNYYSTIMGRDIPFLDWSLIEALADYMAADNPRFDRDQFMAACYTQAP